jgi:phosphopantothenoylcysteine decarboxylase/phosphopantothenate--cysteine ligase
MRILVTAGPTREHLDPVRFLSNRSSGRMGFAVAERAVARGHCVTLVAGPVSLTTPRGVRRLDVVSAREMLAAVRGCLRAADALVMCAAVADWRPRRVSAAKVKKRTMRPVLRLVANPDILKSVRSLRRGRVFVGFAAETGDPVPEARRKVREKDLDLIVANDVTLPGAGFEVATNRAVFVPREGKPQALPLLSKRQVAARLVRWIERRAGVAREKKP